MHQLLDGWPTGAKVPGYELLRQFEIEAGYLPATDYDSVFEETLYLILLEHGLPVVPSGHSAETRTPETKTPTCMGWRLVRNALGGRGGIEAPT